LTSVEFLRPKLNPSRAMRVKSVIALQETFSRIYLRIVLKFNFLSGTDVMIF
jgi:hypothetical protein